jgi:hypothetical protein
MSQSFLSPFTGTVIEPTDVSYYPLAFTTNTQLYWPQIVNPELGQVPASRIMDCSTTVSGLTIFLPNALEGSLGTDIFIRNTGAVSFTVTDATGDAGRTVNPGVTIYFYLTNNTEDIGGIWGNITLGTGTSAADAASLAGAGLTTVLGQLAVSSNVVETSIIPSITNSSRANTYVWTAGVGTITLPAFNTLSGGWWVGFRNGGTGTLTIATQSPSLINGLSSITTNPGDSGFIYFESASQNFFTVGLAPQTNVSFTSGTYDVDSIVGSAFSLVSYAPTIQTYVALSGVRTSTLNITLPAITQLYVLINNTTSGAYSLSFNTSGSLSAPVVLSAGQIALVLSEPSGLFALSTTSANTFFATNGSATAPSYSFTNDNTTGMYLRGAGVLGLTANGAEILDLNGTNSLAPVVSTPGSILVGQNVTVTGTLTANLISGGTF